MIGVNRKQSGESGFSLIELLVAAGIIIMGVTAVLVMFSGTFKTTTASRIRELALNLANEKIEKVRSTAYTDIASGTLATILGTSETRGNAHFTVSYNVQPVDDPADGTGVADPTPVDYKNVTVTVSWTEPAPASSVSIDTLVNNNAVEPISSTNDTQAPVWPNGGGGVLTGETKQTDPGLGCYIKWDPNWATDDQGVVGYLVYRKPPDSENYLLISTVAPSVGWFLDVWYTAEQSYDYYVKAFDSAGNVSGVCNSVSIVGPVDAVNPSVPQNLAVVKIGPTTARLSWSPSDDNSYVAYYNIYRTPAGIPYPTLAVSSPLDDTGLEAGVSYQYYIIAVDSADNKSDKSSSVSVSM